MDVDSPVDGGGRNRVRLPPSWTGNVPDRRGRTEPAAGKGNETGSKGGKLHPAAGERPAGQTRTRDGRAGTGAVPLIHPSVTKNGFFSPHLVGLFGVHSCVVRSAEWPQPKKVFGSGTAVQLPYSTGLLHPRHALFLLHVHRRAPLARVARGGSSGMPCTGVCFALGVCVCVQVCVCVRCVCAAPPFWKWPLSGPMAPSPPVRFLSPSTLMRVWTPQHDGLCCQHQAL